MGGQRDRASLLRQRRCDEGCGLPPQARRGPSAIGIASPPRGAIVKLASFPGAAAAGKKVAVSLNDAQRRRRLFVGLLVEDLGADGIAEVIGDKGGVEGLEIGEGLIGVELVERLQRRIEFAFPGIGPGGDGPRSVRPRV